MNLGERDVLALIFKKVGIILNFIFLKEAQAKSDQEEKKDDDSNNIEIKDDIDSDGIHGNDAAVVCVAYIVFLYRISTMMAV